MSDGSMNGEARGLDGWERWRAERLEGLRAPRGWLSVVGLHWLDEGENRVEGLPGLFTMRDGRVGLTARSSDGWSIGGVAVERRLLAGDDRPDADLLELGGRRWVQVLARGSRRALRVWDSDARARREFRGVGSFPYDPAWRVEARWEPFLEPRAVMVLDVIGNESERWVRGRAVFAVGGRELSLEPTAEANGFHLVFRDATSGAETYGAGRFLSVGEPRDGRVLLDFNRAVNPPCAFTPFATCPLPRPENVLPVRVEAGERFDDGDQVLR